MQKIFLPKGDSVRFDYFSPMNDRYHISITGLSQRHVVSISRNNQDLVKGVPISDGNFVLFRHMENDKGNFIFYSKGDSGQSLGEYGALFFLSQKEVDALRFDGSAILVNDEFI